MTNYVCIMLEKKTYYSHKKS